ncbi:MAG: serine hydrolase domain-containing protein, partial [Planctomycetota bacterium]
GLCIDEAIGMSLKPAIAAVVMLTLTCCLALGQTEPLPFAEPESVGIDPERLQQLSDFIQRGIESGQTPGAVLLVARNGKIVLHEAYGERNPVTSEAMTRDSIFRIFSMGKGLTAAASLRLIERGELSFDAPLSNYLPEFSSMRVVDRTKIGFKRNTYATAEADEEINIADLLRHSAGFGGYNFYPGYIGNLFRRAGVGSWNMSIAEATENAAKIPLLYQPGTTYSYSETAYNTLGRTLEVVRNVPIGDVMRAELFEPIGMIDTGFEVPPDKADRVAERLDTGEEKPNWFDVTKPRKFHSPANGIVSTSTDYWRFVQVLLDNGRAPTGAMLLAPSSVDAMLSDNVSDLRDGLIPRTVISKGWTWGLGLYVNVPNKPSMILGGSKGGLFMLAANGGTAYIASRKDNFVAILMNPQVEYIATEFATFATLALQTIRD